MVNGTERERGLWQRWGSLGLAAWCVLLVALAYGDALRLPFFFDDFVHLPYVDAYSLREMWQTAGSLAYYRPLSFTIWKIMYLVVGHHSPFLQHALNLLLHTVNGFMVGWLFWRLEIGGRRTMAGGFLSATLFLLFPFSYQAVPWIGSMSHLLVTSLILLALVGYWHGREGDGRLWYVLSLAAAALAPFAHENGVLVGPLVALVELTEPAQREAWRRTTGRVALWSLPALLWLPVWWLAPKAVSGTVTIRGGEAMLQNVLYFLQGLAYPLTQLGGWLHQHGMNDLAAAGVLSAVALGSAAGILVITRAGRRALLPWLWYAVTMLPAVLFLSFDYVINGPRLLMLASVGAAWLWTDVIVTIVKNDRTSVRDFVQLGWFRLLTAVFLLIVLVQNGRFIQERMTIHQTLGNVYNEVVEIASQANQQDQTAVFINLPSWITPGTATYAVGHEGVQFWPDYAQPHTLASVTTGQPADIALFRNEAIRPEMPYFYGVSGQAADWPSLATNDAAVFVADYQPQAINLRPVGILGVEESAIAPVATFNQGQIILEATKTAPSGDGTAVRLTWHVTEPPPESLTVFVHVIDASGQLLLQADGDPLAGSFPLGQWPAGLTAEDQRYIPISGEGLQVLVGLYDRNSGERWTAETATGESWPDNAVRFSIAPDG
ncbi:MAG: hypothetical protein WAM60_17415 [Candidatus Promineifilaceae bacterium]